MMAKDPAQRYPTPERAAQALQVFLAAGTEALAAPEADPRMRPYLTWLEVESGAVRPVRAGEVLARIEEYGDLLADLCAGGPRVPD